MPEIPAAPAAINLGLMRDARPGLVRRIVKTLGRFVRGLRRLVGTLFTIGFSLLPLSALLVALPLVAPTEAVLTETIRPAKSRWRRAGRRVLALVAGIAGLVVLLAFSLEGVSPFPLRARGHARTVA